MLRLGQHCRSVGPTLSMLFQLCYHCRSVGPTLVMLFKPCDICSNINKIKQVLLAAASNIST